jgi:hypothetical protein
LSDAVPLSATRPLASTLDRLVIATRGATASSLRQRSRSASSVCAAASVVSSSDASSLPPHPTTAKPIIACASQVARFNFVFIPNCPSVLGGVAVLR